MRLRIVDYGSGNLRSVAKAFEYVGNGADIAVTARASDLDEATHIVLPGVGAFADCVRGLHAVPGMREALERNVRERKKPFLGICVGMQMLLEEGHEHGIHKGLGWFRGKVAALTPKEAGLKVPHMGWNTLKIRQPAHRLLKGIKTGDHAYFVHSYHALCAEAADVLATTDYGGEVVAMIGRDNMIGTQFHPEKSQQAGLQVLSNFLEFS